MDFVINRVSANGRPGLENSLQDIHGAVKETSSKVDTLTLRLEEVYKDTASSRAWSDWFKSTKELIASASVFKIFKTKFGTIVAVFLGILFINSLLHPLLGDSYNLTFQSLFKFIAHLWGG